MAVQPGKVPGDLSRVPELRTCLWSKSNRGPIGDGFTISFSNCFRCVAFRNVHILILRPTFSSTARFPRRSENCLNAQAELSCGERSTMAAFDILMSSMAEKTSDSLKPFQGGASEPTIYWISTGPSFDLPPWTGK